MGEEQNFSGNLEILPGFKRLGHFSGNWGIAEKKQDTEQNGCFDGLNIWEDLPNFWEVLKLDIVLFKQC